MYENKTRFQNEFFLLLKTYYRNIGKNGGLPSESNWLGNPPKQSLGFLRDDLLDNLPTQSSGKSSFEFPFHNHFPLKISCHALTPITLGCPSAYGMHYANSYHLC